MTLTDLEVVLETSSPGQEKGLILLAFRFHIFPYYKFVLSKNGFPLSLRKSMMIILWVQTPQGHNAAHLRRGTLSVNVTYVWWGRCWGVNGSARPLHSIPHFSCLWCA